jgi:predicted AAA+ superfamily ATPase
MLSHYHGQTLNYSELGRSFGISDKTIKRYIDILEDTFMIRTLKPWHANIGKRLIKSPKFYIQDSGIFHALQGIDSYDHLITNPKIGASWEGFALQLVISMLGKRDNEIFFYGVHGGVEVDLFWHSKTLKLGIEFKYSDAPKITRSMYQAIDDLNLDHLFIIYPGDKIYPLDERMTAIPLGELNESIFSL